MLSTFLMKSEMFFLIFRRKQWNCHLSRSRKEVKTWLKQSHDAADQETRTLSLFNNFSLLNESVYFLLNQLEEWFNDSLVQAVRCVGGSCVVLITWPASDDSGWSAASRDCSNHVFAALLDAECGHFFAFCGRKSQRYLCCVDEWRPYGCGTTWIILRTNTLHNTFNVSLFFTRSWSPERVRHAVVQSHMLVSVHCR